MPKLQQRNHQLPLMLLRTNIPKAKSGFFSFPANFPDLKIFVQFIIQKLSLSVYNFVAGIIKYSSTPEEFNFGYFYCLSSSSTSFKLKRVGLSNQYSW
ncbi:hypothetical protein ACX27_15730 [Nostoc piscinale CENA21]|uniref:Uncharacterized protein n=1 Tax=Nostoc piscinale CENA21 TaxID=224013 RepID=A0A0M4TX79_9NOSO|nr:hypothetical protein ACX27_15730 [Nostoc piscinale CENA21]